MFSRLAKTNKKYTAPKKLRDALSGVGSGHSLCLVSDTRADGSLTAYDLALSLSKDGFHVTLLDLNPYPISSTDLPASEGGTSERPYAFVKLAGIFQEKNWYPPMQAFCVYQWLKTKTFDLILFQHGFGSGYFCGMAKELGLSFKETPLVLLPDDPYAMWLEACRRFPSFETVRNDSETDYLERMTVMRADALIFSKASTLDWMQNVGWPLEKTEKTTAVIDNIAEETKGALLKSLIGKGAQLQKEQAPPLLSICVISNGKARQLKELLASLDAQTYHTFELFLTELQGSIPNMTELEANYSGIFKERGWNWSKADSQQNEAALRNEAARKAKGAYIVFLDEDDVLMPDALEVFSKALSSGLIDILTSVPGAYVNTDNTIGVLARVPSRFKWSVKEISVGWIYYGANLAVSPFANVLGDASALFRRELFLELGGFDECRPNLFYGWNLLIKAINKGHLIHAVPEVLILYRRDKNFRSNWVEGKYESSLKILAEIGERLPPNLRALLLPYRSSIKQRVLTRYREPNLQKGAVSYKAHLKDLPQIKNDTIEIILAADDNYLIPLCVTIASILSTTKGPLRISVISDFSQESKSAVTTVGQHFGGQIDFLELQKKHQRSFPSSQMWGRESSATYVRLWLANYLPDKKKILYLDCDILVRHDLRALWSYELGSEVIGAIRDPFVSKVEEVDKNFGGDYFNAGVLLINLEAWRKDEIGKKALSSMRMLEDQNYPYIFHEQSPLNKAVNGKWVRLPPTWNYAEDIDLHYGSFNLDAAELRSLKADAALYHFRTSKKPWRPDADISSSYVREYKIYQNRVEGLVGSQKETAKEPSTRQSKHLISTKELPVISLAYQASPVGRERQVCIVSDCSCSDKTDQDFVTKLKADGWQVTVLDLSEPSKPNNLLKDVTYQRLAGFYDETNWYIELQSLLAYHWLRSQRFDLILFNQGFASGFYSVSARHLKLAFKDTKIIVLLGNPHSLTLEKKELFPSGRHDFEYDFMERKTVEGADAVLLPSDENIEWLIKKDWVFPKSIGLLKTGLTSDLKKWGEFLSDLCQKSSTQRKEIKDPLYISVCIATYNRAPWLREALLALEKQTYKHFEVVVIDDGSTDLAVDNLEIELKPIFDARKWRWIKLENQGPARARNYAAQIARSDHLLFMDDDNLAYPDELERFALAAEGGYDILTPILGMHPESEIAFKATAALPDRDAKELRPVGWTPIGGNLILAAFINVLGDTNSLFRRDVFEKLEGFSSEKGVLFEDFDLLTRALIAGYKIEVIPEILMLYRRTKRSRSMGAKIFEGAISSLKPLAELLPSELRPLLLGLRHEWYERHSKRRAGENE